MTPRASRCARELRDPCRLRRIAPWLAGALLAVTVGGCAGTPALRPANDRAFRFEHDTFAYANELDWEYRTDPATGEITTHQNEPAPEFSHRCFAVARMARQFFQYAEFDASRPPADDAAYREAIDAVVSRTPSAARRHDKVLIPGYADLRSFSQAQEAMLKTAAGGPLRSLFQFSNWRMIFPFSRAHQEATAQQLQAEVAANRLAIVHLIRFAPFPITSIDHAVVIFAVDKAQEELRFRVYDPNDPEKPGLLTFDRATRTFFFPSTPYFTDGPIDVYEIDDDEID